MKRKTNVQFVKQIMEAGSPLNQIFVIECLEKYSKHVLDNKEALRKSMENHMIHPDAWISCAEHVQKELQNRHL